MIFSYGIQIWTDLSSVWQTDRRTDGQTDGQTNSFLIASPRWHSIKRGKTVNFRMKMFSSVPWEEALLLMSLCPSVRPSVCFSVCLSMSFTRQQKAFKNSI